MPKYRLASAAKAEALSSRPREVRSVVDFKKGRVGSLLLRRGYGMSADKTTFRAELPKRLAVEIQSLVDEGWFGSVDEVVGEALRRFVESHRGELMEKFVRDDLEWGLRGHD